MENIRFIDELTEEEIMDLKENYLYDILTEEEAEKYNSPKDIPDNIILQHYRHTAF